MLTRPIGQLRASVVGLGCNQLGTTLDDATSFAVVHAALDHGITFFDTADEYGRSEEVLGRALRGRRDQVVVTKGDAQWRPDSGQYVLRFQVASGGGQVAVIAPPPASTDVRGSAAQRRPRQASSE